MISRERMAAVDRNAEALGVPRRQLMESSGNAVAREVRAVADPGDRVVIVAGRGNNGGDGFVAARFLTDFEVSVQLLGRAETITTEIARANWEALDRSGYEVHEVADSRSFALPDCDVIVDAMLGTGVTGALREPAATAARRINEHEASVIAVDVPSGLDADTGEADGVAVDADRVVTFHDQKPGLVELDVDVTVADIGIPAAAALFVERGDLSTLTRDPESHKGDHGRVLVIGGGPYTGAPALSARAALRAGADLAFIACPSAIESELRGYSENLIVRGFEGERLEPEHVDVLLERSSATDAVILGPGMGDADPTLEAVSDFLEAFDGRVVVDADALQVVPEIETDATLVCTPHQGELRGMGGPSAADWRARADAVEAFARELGHTLLVKGAHDVVSDGETVRVNRTGNPGMTVGGTGDVLAGVTGALLSADDRAPVTAAAIAAYANGLAGDQAVEEYGYGLLATDLIDRLPAALWGEQS